MPHYSRHIFICTNRRDPDNPKGSCALKNSDAICQTFKKELSLRGLRGKMRANSSGCLDRCEHGPSVVVYPEQVLYTYADRADIDEIVEQHLVQGKSVDRLKI